MDPQTHKVAVVVAAIFVGLSYLVMVASMAYLAMTHDGVYAQYLNTALVVSGIILGCLILGTQTVLVIAQWLGFRVPNGPQSPTASDVGEKTTNNETGVP